MQKRLDFSEVIKGKYPESISYAVAQDACGMAKPITLGWVMQTSHVPAMFAISVSPQRYSCEVIRKAGCFTLVFPTNDDAKQALYFGTKSGRDTNKISESKTNVSEAAVIDSVILDDAAANFECELVDQMVTGDHVIFVGKVVAAHANTEKKGRLYTVAPGWKMGAVTAVEK